MYCLWVKLILKKIYFFQSSHLCDCIYNGNWRKMKMDMKSNVCFTMLRFQKPFVLRTVFFTINLKNFTNVRNKYQHIIFLGIWNSNFEFAGCKCINFVHCFPSIFFEMKHQVYTNTSNKNISIVSLLF